MYIENENGEEIFAYIDKINNKDSDNVTIIVTRTKHGIKIAEDIKFTLDVKTILNMLNDYADKDKLVVE